MAEAEGVLARKLRLVRPDKLLAHERRQPRRHLRARPARAPELRRGGRRSPRPSRARAPPRSAGSSWSSRAASSAWIVGGTTTSSPGDSRTIATISSTNSGLPSAASRDPLARGPASSVDEALDQAVGLGRAERLEQDGRRVHLPAAPSLAGGRAAPGRAMQSSRIGASRERSATCSTRSRNVSSRPVDVVEDDRRAGAPRRRPRAACGRPRRSRRSASAPARRAATGSRRGRRRRRTPSCLTTSTTGQ